MGRRRRFSRGERITLFLTGRGTCAICGEVLQRGWHADHVTPYARGGETVVTNGQALCPRCNLEKGDQVITDERLVETDGINLRPTQKEVETVCLQKLANGETTVVVESFPGSGKTIAYLNAANRLYREGVIDAVVVAVPRINLATQGELDWDEIRPRYRVPVMGKIVHRENNPPLFRDDHFGYLTTYGSLTSRPDLHLGQLDGKRFMLVLDEAQQLGFDEDDGGTRSAQIIQSIGAEAAFRLVLSGFSRRGDKLPLLYGQYSEPDEKGLSYLLADVRATYRDGVTLGYLREFDFTLVNGAGVWEGIDGDTKDLDLAAMKVGIRKIIGDREYWEPMVDMTVERVVAVQEIDRRFRGLIGASTQAHADEILTYLRKRHPGVRALLAVSNERLAQDNLKKFRKGNYDILVTVAMAHVGYDCKAICVVCMLNDFREWGWVLQFIGRGLRRMDGIPPERQVLHGIFPADPKSKQICEWLRNESRLGIRARSDRSGGLGVQPKLGITRDVEQTDISTIGFTPNDDIAPEEWEYINQLARESRLISVPYGRLKDLLQRAGAQSSGPKSEQKKPRDDDANLPQMTDTQRLRVLSNEINTKCVGMDQRLLGVGYPEIYHGWSATQVKYAFSPPKRLKECGKAELEARKQWFDEVLVPTVNEMMRNHDRATS